MHYKQNNKQSKIYVQGLRPFGNTLPRGVKGILKKNGYNFCYQPLFDLRGEVTTAWKIKGKPSGKQQLITSVHHSYPAHNSMEIVTGNLEDGEKLIKENGSNNV